MRNIENSEAVNQFMNRNLQHAATDQPPPQGHGSTILLVRADLSHSYFQRTFIRKMKSVLRPIGILGRGGARGLRTAVPAAEKKPLNWRSK